MSYSKNDVFLLLRFFPKHIDKCRESYCFNPLYSNSTPKFTFKAGIKNTGVKLDYVTDYRLGLSLQNNMRGGHSSCLGNRL